MKDRRRRFDEVYAAARDSVWRYLRRMAPPGERDDVFQETWLEIFRALDDPARVIEHPRAYAVRVARSRLGRGARAPGAMGGEVVDEIAAAEAAEGGLRGRIEAALDVLSPEQREAFLLRHDGELGYGEIAEVTGVPEGTVASRIHEAGRRLRAALEADGTRARRSR